MYQVENIVNSRVRKGKKQYEIKWKGYDHSENTWEPEKNLVSSKQLLHQYEQSQKISEGPKNLRSKAIPSRYDHAPDNIYHGSDEQQEEGNDDITDEGAGKKKKGKQKTKNSVDKNDLKPQLRILAMSETPDHQLVYKTLIEADVKWVKRSFLIPDYLLELVQFYQSNMTFKN